ncbi:glucose/arabinose dehydrogenase [Geothermobacter ehrlichii]|uniref:Glucose/arabinose dehydrogenase n=1 Tax=Geothermobacter ehrlichii TaxID=213224 RepID=A0A5D3WPM2_9BACT|nr:PQQ-dependent sugar dehydrogenase [Geothermobacter ehrlichii]TYP00294.1 glucose/arabinose dehydrogenase [Geothermobacter ehrlichii]
MGPRTDRRPTWLSFVLLTLLLAAGIFAGAIADRLPLPELLSWLLPVGLLSLALGLFLRRFSSWYLFLALPMAAVLAWSVEVRIWPNGFFHRRTASVDIAGDLRPTPLKLPEGTDDNTLKNRRLFAPEHAEIGLFAHGLAAPRMLAFDSRGVLFVSLPGQGRVLALPDRDRDGFADETVEFAAGLDRPHGLAFAGGALLVAESGRLLRLQDRDGDLRADAVRVISDDLPSGGGHWTRSLAVGPDDALYVSVGSDCNACLEEDPRRGTILRFSPDGGEGRIHAWGLRNSVGLTFQPGTDRLWASDNGRDMLGDDLPPDEINLVVEGGDYGWPFCYGNRVPDPGLGTDVRCADTRPAAVELQAHSAPLGLVFGAGLAAESSWRDDLFVAFHGSWNRRQPTGYKVVRIPFRQGRPAGPPEDVLAGWRDGKGVWGRPVGLAVGPDGALYLSDDRAGCVYRIVFKPDAGRRE